ncbi:uncharacterized protein A1O5_09434 [Cladophialophora psammophila CBS 110553]|uniref:DUF7580 domain-containing protein n=1 Tax=Cladophialophora psammophila CBS 110553 TaxID=1182543 RepID=W9WS04_9EURO|nr:uncharacterized protein A1O5_09434 [Cladophialophora psammophila CBS 110553]EXJ67421.1 hypothetical protein A1O5_09434 [Cladophialophora psammophila CBS 110553]
MAEFTLAVLPLVITALEHYSTVSRTISRYRNFSDQVQEFFAELDVQCKIFQTSVQLLLTPEVGDDQAVRMLQDENDRGWKDAQLDTYLSERFSGGTASAARNCLDLIRRQIVKLLEVSESFKYIEAEVEEDGTLSFKRRARLVGKKIDMACSKGRIETRLKSLRDRTQDFRVLVQQTERLAERHALQEPSRFAKAKLERFKTVKSAANNLYAAFGQACTKHTEHQGYIGLQPTHNGFDHVNFVLAFRSLTIQSTSSKGPDPPGADVVWFTIESTITASIRPIKSNGVLESMNKAAKRAIDASSEDPKASADAAQKGKKQKKTVSFQSTPPDCRLIRPPCASKRVPSLDTLANLCSHNNFCNQMHKVFGQSKLPPDRCIGYLETNDGSKHLVYIHSRMEMVTSVTKRVEIRALSELLKETARSMQQGDFLAPHRRIHVGKQLALALLQFHETCWLKESWSSDDIMISNVDKDQGSDSPHNNDSAEESYANVSIQQQGVTVRSPQKKPLPYIRNRSLFNLGKILLELAFQDLFGN